MADDASNVDNLGSLAQSARTKQLKSARTILFVVGVLTIVVNAFLVVQAETLVDNELKAEIEKVRRQGMEVDQQAVEEIRESAVQTLKLFNGAAVAVGVVFIVFGFLVYQYPVPITITSLVLYIGSMAVFGFLDPTTLAKGFIIKIIIIVALANAIKAALAYEKEQRRLASAKRPTSGFEAPGVEF